MSSTGPAAKNRTSASAGNASDGEHSSIVLGPRDRLVGQLYIEGDLRVVGTVEGELEVTGSVVIDDGGNVTGPVTARDRLVVGRSGSLKGDVRVARLVVHDGAAFSGKVSMGKAVEAPPKPVEPAKVPEPVKPPEAVRLPETVKVPDVVKPLLVKPPQAVKPQPVKVQAVKPPQPVKVQAVKPPQPTKHPQKKPKRR